MNNVRLDLPDHRSIVVVGILNFEVGGELPHSLGVRVTAGDEFQLRNLGIDPGVIHAAPPASDDRGSIRHRHRSGGRNPPARKASL